MSLSGLQELTLLVSLCALTVPTVPSDDFVRFILPPSSKVFLTVSLVWVELWIRKFAYRHSRSVCENTRQLKVDSFRSSFR